MLRNYNNFNGHRGASAAHSRTFAGGTVSVRTHPKGRETAAAFLFAVMVAIFALLAAPISADDFSEGFGGGFDEGFSSGESTETGSENTGSSTGDSGTQSSTSGGGMFAESGLEWSGFVSTTMRAYADYEDPETGEINTYPEVGLDLSYSGANSEAVANLRFHRDWLYDAGLEQQASGHKNVLWYLQQMIDEAYLRLFYDHFNLQTGFLKEVWGTGDQSHVVDVLNPTDYYDFVNIDYIERKTAEFMFKLNIPFGMNGLVQLAYVPTFTPDSSPLYGRWAPASMGDLTTLIESGVELNRPQMNTLSDGQYAARVSGTAGGVDLAATYYFGYLRNPNAEVTYSGTYPNLVPEQINLSYDRLHVFGLDAAGVLAGFNLRGEAAYYLTEDYEGEDDIRTNNHSLQYVAGFDRNLPLSNLNLNIQNIGFYYLNEDDDPTSNILSAALSDSWNNDKIKPEVAVSYGIEKQDFMLRPEITFDLIDDVQLTAEYAAFIGDEDGRFGQFDDNGYTNDYAQITLTYNF